MTLTAPDPEPDSNSEGNASNPVHAWRDRELRDALDSVSAQERIQAELSAIEVEMDDARHYRDAARQLALLDYLGRLNGAWARGEDPLRH